jgi:hypothetical protein
MFGNDKVEVSEGGGSKYLGYGNHLAAITGFEVKTSKAGDAWQVILHIETPTITEEGFKADDSAVRGGRIGKVKLADTYYKTEEQIRSFDGRMQLIAKKLGAEEALIAAKAGAQSIEEYMNRVLPVIKNKDLYLQCCAKEYIKQDGKIGTTLHLGFKKFCASLAEGVSHMDAFDKENKYHYTKVTPAEETPANETPTNNSVF